MIKTLTNSEPDSLSRVNHIINNSIIILIITLLVLIKKKRGRIEEKKITASAAYIAITITVLMVNMVITSLHYFQNYVTEVSGIIIMRVVEGMALISVLILIIVVYYIYNMNSVKFYCHFHFQN